MAYKYTLVGLIIGGGIAYWGYTEGVIDLPIALILAVVGIIAGWGYDRGETDVDVARSERLPAAIFTLLIGIIFLLASPLFDYDWDAWWPINGVWNMFCSIPILIVGVYLLSKG
jgi:hypothetical protein